MMTITAAEIATATGGDLYGDPLVAVSGPVVIDSRLVEPGALFVALPGNTVDGHDFVSQAVGRGAVLSLTHRPMVGNCVVVPDVQRALGDLARFVVAQLRHEGTVQVVGITGSVGKTTTKDLVGQLLSSQGLTVVPRGSFNNEIGLPLTLLEATRDTRYMVAEMGASGIGHLEYLTSIVAPDIAVVLGVGRAHLGEFGGIDAVAQAKSEIVTGVAPGGTCVFNADDSRVMAMATLAAGRVITFGRGIDADFRAENIQLGPSGTAQFALIDQRDRDAVTSADVSLQLVGEHQVTNALAAAAVSLELGMSLDSVAQLLSQAIPISPRRMQVVQRGDGVIVVDDSYNANPDSMSAALRALQILAASGQRSWAVLGEMLELGSDAEEAHRQIGRFAGELGIDVLLVVGLEASAIADGARSHRSGHSELLHVESVEAAATLLAERLRPGDVVLVKASHGSSLWRLGDVLLRSDA